MTPRDEEKLEQTEAVLRSELGDRVSPAVLHAAAVLVESWMRNFPRIKVAERGDAARLVAKCMRLAATVRPAVELGREGGGR